MKYGISTSKLIHIIQDHPNNGLYGNWHTKCGGVICPLAVTDTIPQGAKLCARCKAGMDKEEAANDQ